MLGISKLTSLARRAVGAVANLLGNVWRTRYSGQQFNQIRFLNNQFVAVGNNNQVAFSSDAIAWTFSNVPIVATGGSGQFNCNAVSYAAGVYVVVCSNGSIFTSPDLVTWTARTSGTTAVINDVWTDGTNFVAAGATNAVTRYSSDAGVTWTAWSTGLAAAAYSFVRYTPNTSTSAPRWVIASKTTSQPYYANSLGGTWTVGSYDAATFGTVNAMAFSSSLEQFFIGSLTGKIKFSTDGVSWTDSGLSTATTAINDFAPGSAGVATVAVGNTGLIASNAGGTWAVRTSGLTDNGFAVEYGNGRWVAGFNLGNIRYSTNATTWTNPGSFILQDTQGTSSNPVVSGILYSSIAGKFVIATVRGMFYTTTAATGTFTRAGHITHYAGGTLMQYNGNFYADFNGTFAQTSDAGATWIATTSLTRFNDVLYADSLYIRCGAGGLLSTSTDGTTWTARTSGTARDLYKIAYDATATYPWVVAGRGVILYSSNGTTWTAKESDTRAYVDTMYTTGSNSAFPTGITPVLARGGYVYTVDNTTGAYTFQGQMSFTSATDQPFMTYNTNTSLYIGVCGTKISTSPDLVTWTLRTTVTGGSLLAVAVGSGADDGRCLAVGSAGISYYSTNGGITWNAESTGTTQTFNGVVYVDSSLGFVAAANGGVTRRGQPNSVTLGSVGVATNCLDITCSPGGRLAVGGAGGMIRTSTDGINWTAQTSGTTTPVNGITYSTVHSKFIAVSAINTSTLRITQSTDGITWSNAAVSITNANITPGWVKPQNSAAGLLISSASVTYNRIFLMTSDSTANLYDMTHYNSITQFYTIAPPKYLNGNWYFFNTVLQAWKTSDFTTWTQVRGLTSSSATNGNWMNNKFMMASNSVYSSTDGETWTTEYTQAQPLVSLKYRNGYYIATSAGAVGVLLYYSATGSSWAFIQPDTAPRAQNFCEYFNGYWYVGGNAGALWRGPNPNSTTGWTRLTTQTGSILRAIAVDDAGNNAIMIGDAGAIVTSNSAGT